MPFIAASSTLRGVGGMSSVLSLLPGVRRARRAAAPRRPRARSVCPGAPPRPCNVADRLGFWGFCGPMGVRQRGDALPSIAVSLSRRSGTPCVWW